MRARQWSPELGVFLSVDDYQFHDGKTTLWGWPSQSPIRDKDPFGRGKFCIPINWFLTICIQWPDKPANCSQPPNSKSDPQPKETCTFDHFEPGGPPLCWYECPSDGKMISREHEPFSDRPCPGTTERKQGE